MKSILPTLRTEPLVWLCHLLLEGTCHDEI
jgi:hypothetical protein